MENGKWSVLGGFSLFFPHSFRGKGAVGSVLGGWAHWGELCGFCACHRYLRGRQQGVGSPDLADLCQRVNSGCLKSEGLWYEPYLVKLMQHRINVLWDGEEPWKFNWQKTCYGAWFIERWWFIKIDGSSRQMVHLSWWTFIYDLIAQNLNTAHGGSEERRQELQKLGLRGRPG